jgi:uncharacterized protein (DUF1778 family)
MRRILKRRSGFRGGKSERLEARITVDQKLLIERAAKLRGTTVTEFVVASAQQAASETIKDFEVLSLQGEAKNIFVHAVLNPTLPNQVARAAARRYKQQLRG